MQQLLARDDNTTVLSLLCRVKEAPDEDDSVIADIREALAVAKKASDHVILADLGHTAEGPKLVFQVLLERCRQRFDPSKPEGLWLLESLVDLQQCLETVRFWDRFVMEPVCTDFLFKALDYAAAMVRWSPLRAQA